MIRIPHEEFKPEVGYAKYNDSWGERFIIYGRVPELERVRFNAAYATISGGSHPGRYYPRHTQYAGKQFVNSGIVYAPYIPVFTGKAIYFKLTEEEVLWHVCLERI